MSTNAMLATGALIPPILSSGQLPPESLINRNYHRIIKIIITIAITAICAISYIYSLPFWATSLIIIPLAISRYIITFRDLYTKQVDDAVFQKFFFIDLGPLAMLIAPDFYQLGLIVSDIAMQCLGFWESRKLKGSTSFFIPRPQIPDTIQWDNALQILGLSEEDAKNLETVEKVYQSNRNVILSRAESWPPDHPIHLGLLEFSEALRVARETIRKGKSA
ncbi:MAG: hypothetical protein HW387_1376 [Parachlamydiales bacterium]|nr:hypothetical protein [Parachlamydiales bacterium]